MANGPPAPIPESVLAQLAREGETFLIRAQAPDRVAALANAFAADEHELARAAMAAARAGSRESALDPNASTP